MSAPGRCAACYRLLRAAGYTHEQANQEARASADIWEDISQHIAEHSHNEWERARPYDGETWDDWQVEWYSLGAYLGDGHFEVNS